MRIRNLLSSAALGALIVGSTGPAMALEIPLGGYTGKINIKFSNFESFTGTGGLAASNSNFGIISVTSILDASNGILYQSPVTPTASNPLIVGVFSGIHVKSSTGSSAEADTAGSFSFYWDTKNTFSQIAAQGTGGYAAAGGGCAPNQQCYHLITDQGYENLLNFSLVPGASSTDITSFLHAGIATTDPLTGHAEGFAVITGGTDAGQLQKGGLTTAAGTLADLFLQDDFCQNTAPNCAVAGDWFASSQDPVVALIPKVPEPMSLALLGSALLGFGAFGWRRRRRE